MRRLMMIGLGLTLVTALVRAGGRVSDAPSSVRRATEVECGDAKARLVNQTLRRQREVAAAESALSGGVVAYDGVFGGFLAAVEADARNSGNYAIEEELRRNLQPIDREIERLTVFVTTRCDFTD